VRPRPKPARGHRRHHQHHHARGLQAPPERIAHQHRRRERRPSLGGFWSHNDNAGNLTYTLSAGLFATGG